MTLHLVTAKSRPWHPSGIKLLRGTSPSRNYKAKTTENNEWLSRYESLISMRKYDELSLKSSHSWSSSELSLSWRMHWEKSTSSRKATKLNSTNWRWNTLKRSMTCEPNSQKCETSETMLNALTKLSPWQRNFPNKESYFKRWNRRKHSCNKSSRPSSVRVNRPSPSSSRWRSTTNGVEPEKALDVSAHSPWTVDVSVHVPLNLSRPRTSDKLPHLRQTHSQLSRACTTGIGTQHLI